MALSLQPNHPGENMQIKISSNVKEVSLWTKTVHKKQIPLATAMAINDTLLGLKKEMAKQTVKKLDRPTKTTQNGFLFSRASKRKLVGRLFIKDFVEKYLQINIDGGIRSPGKRFPVPTKNSKLNKFGNIVGKKTGLIKNSKQFFGTINGVTGVYERTNAGQKIKIIHVLAKSATYQPKFPFFTIAKMFTQNMFDKNLTKAFNRAVKTAK